MTTTLVIPAAGLTIVDPAAGQGPEMFLPAEGREVEWSAYWERRLRDGDVTAVGSTPDPEPDPEPAPEPEPDSAAG